MRQITLDNRTTVRYYNPYSYEIPFYEAALSIIAVSCTAIFIISLSTYILTQKDTALQIMILIPFVSCSLFACCFFMRLKAKETAERALTRPLDLGRFTIITVPAQPA